MKIQHFWAHVVMYAIEVMYINIINIILVTQLMAEFLLSIVSSHHNDFFTNLF